MLGPQIGFAINDVKAEVGPDKPVDVIELLDYGTMNGKKVLEFALAKLNSK